MKHGELLQNQQRQRPLPSPFPKVTLRAGLPGTFNQASGTLELGVGGGGCGRVVFPSQFLPLPSCTLSHSSNWWKSLISSSVFHITGVSEATEESRRLLGGIFHDLFLVLDQAGAGRKAQFIPNAPKHSRWAFWEMGATKFLGFPGNLCWLQTLLSRPALDNHFLVIFFP